MWKPKNLLKFALLLLSGCGYHLDTAEQIAVSVPYVKNDFQGELTDALIWAVSRTPQLRFCHGEGNWILSAKILGTDNERIGYRYDRDRKEHTLKNNLVGTENRKTISVEVTVTSSSTGKVVIGPQVIKADLAYDYVDQNSLFDLSFDNVDGTRDSSLAFSLGQLDSVGTAGEDAIYPIYKKLAQQIVEGMLATGIWNG